MREIFRAAGPTSALLVLVILIFAAAAVPTIIVARLPTLGMAAALPGSGLFRFTRAGDLPGSFKILAVKSMDERRAVVNIAASDVIDWDLMDYSSESLARQDQLAEIASEGRVILELANDRGQKIRIIRDAIPVGWKGVWAALPLVVGSVFCGIIGAWILALNASRLATIAAAGSGFGLLIAGIPMIFAVSSEIIVGHFNFAMSFDINALGSLVFGSSLLALFARHPEPLCSPRVTAILAAGPMLLLAAILAIPEFGVAMAALNVAVAIEGLAIIALAILQWRASQLDPRSGAFMRWVGAAALLSVTAYLCAYQLPFTMGLPSFLGPAAAIWIFTPLYLALVIGVVRFRALELERWSVAVLGYASLVILVSVTDAAFIFGLNMAPSRATLLAISVTFTAWLFLRERIRRRFLRGRAIHRPDLLRLAVQAVLIRNVGLRAQHWEETLRTLFQPLEIAPANVSVDHAMIEQDGLIMVMPAAAGNPPLTLHYARAGRSLFNRDDARIADEFVALCRAVDEDRDAYDRGVREERERIARDLHDDVGARLLSSLHRDDTKAVRSDVRAALSDMRAIVAGLVGERVALHATLATLRQEAAERLGAAGIVLEWPSNPIEHNPVLDYGISKDLGSAVRELITNAIRHAGATKVLVETSLDAGALVMRISDDGVGMPSRAGRVSGLLNVSTRLQRHGGELVVRSVADGATLVIQLPLQTPCSGDRQAKSAPTASVLA